VAIRPNSLASSGDQFATLDEELPGLLIRANPRGFDGSPQG